MLSGVTKILELEVATYFSKKLSEPLFVPVGYFTPFDGISQSKKFSFELKFEQQAAVTRNLCMEYSYRGKPSGIIGTEASHWIHCFPLDREKISCLQFDVDDLRQMLALFPLLTGGDGKRSRFKLMPIDLAQKVAFDKFTLTIHWQEYQPYWGKEGKYEGG